MRVLDYVLVSQHITVGGYHYAGTGTAASSRLFAGTAHIDADHCRTDMLNGTDHSLRVSVQRLVVLRPWSRIIFLQHSRSDWGLSPMISSHPTHMGDAADPGDARIP